MSIWSFIYCDNVFLKKKSLKLWHRVQLIPGGEKMSSFNGTSYDQSVRFAGLLRVWDCFLDEGARFRHKGLQRRRARTRKPVVTATFSNVTNSGVKAPQWRKNWLCLCDLVRFSDSDTRDETSLRMWLMCVDLYVLWYPDDNRQPFRGTGWIQGTCFVMVHCLTYLDHEWLNEF